ncbi:MAG TPA: hypothetical protein VMM83_04255 [Longimicrobiales bacterium]|nr:hypothetical protein [Longimicrobiales bacterium]
MNEHGKPRRMASITAALALLAFPLSACDPGADSPDAADDAASAAAADTTEIDDAVGTTTAGLVDPNEAPEAELRMLGLDSADILTIIDGRPFNNMEPLDELLSARMDSAALDGLYRRMFIPLDLNTATREEILLIPGVGPRMAHEFEEYRPYRGIEQFRREIGKYVPDNEVARLERYVTIR